MNNGYIPAGELKSQDYVNQICEWTSNNKMKLNVEKSNVMVFNPTKSKFITRISMNEKILPIIGKTKLLGTVITEDLKWDENTSEIIKKANQRLLLLRKVKEYTNNVDDLKTIYISYVRSILEQSSVVWGSSLTH